MLKQKSDVYQWLRRQLSRDPREDVWSELEESGYVSQVLEACSHEDQEVELASLLEHYKTQDRRYPAGARPRSDSPPKPVAEGPPSERLGYLSQLVALDAACEPAVIRFREEVLGGQLLDPSDWNVYPFGSGAMAHWLSEQSAKNPEQFEADIVYWPDGVDQTLDVCRMKSYIAIDPEYRPEGGPVAWLHEISAHLGSQYRWKYGDAQWFVLTGEVPRLASMNVLRESRFRYPGLARVTLTVDFALSPREIAEWYTKYRKDILNYESPESVGKRNRPMTTKHLALAVFLHAHQGEKYGHLMRLWNEERPEWRYTQVTNFARDAKHAHERLTGQVSNGRKGATNG